MANEFSLTVLSGGMDDEDALYRTRQGFWLRMAREAKGLNQVGAAHLVGLRTKSALSDYEKGNTPVPMRRLRPLAKAYGWALILFTEPMPTAEEMAQERMAQLTRAALRVAERDEAQEAGEAIPGAADTPAAPPRRRSA